MPQSDTALLSSSLFPTVRRSEHFPRRTGERPNQDRHAQRVGERYPQDRLKLEIIDPIGDDPTKRILVLVLRSRLR